MRSILIFAVADTISAPVWAAKESREKQMSTPNPTTDAADRSARGLAVQAGVDPNLKDRNGNRPLQWSGDHHDIASMLVARGGVSF